MRAFVIYHKAISKQMPQKIIQMSLKITFTQITLIKLQPQLQVPNESTFLNRISIANYFKTSNTRCTLGNKIVDHSYVVGASPVGAAPTTSSFST